jgi:hypothetical protein
VGGNFTCGDDPPVGGNHPVGPREPADDFIPVSRARLPHRPRTAAAVPDVWRLRAAAVAPPHPTRRIVVGGSERWAAMAARVWADNRLPVDPVGTAIGAQRHPCPWST